MKEICSEKTAIVLLLIVCFSLPVIGNMQLVRFAVARPASSEGWIVFVRQGKGIWIMDADGKNERQITDILAGNPVFSPDGQQIAFRGPVGIYTMNADGSGVRQITDGTYDDFPAWSPDGRQIAFTRAVIGQENGEREVKSEAIYVMDSDGANLRRLSGDTPPFERAPNWSPDGQKIAFHVWGSPIVKTPEIWVVDEDGGNRERLSNPETFATYPVWSPDGRKIAFESTSVQDDSLDIRVMDADGGNAETLTHRNGWCEDYPAWSPDGTEMVFSAFECQEVGNPEQRDIYVMSADGSDIRRLTNTKENEFSPDWTAFPYAVEPAGKWKTTWGSAKCKYSRLPIE